MPIYQGTLWQKAFVLKSKTTGNPMPITGWTFRLQIRKHVTDADPALLDLTTANGGIYVDDGDAGRIIVVLDEDQTAGLAVGSYKFDVLRTDAESGGGPIWLFGGKIKVKQPVTRE